MIINMKATYNILVQQPNHSSQPNVIETQSELQVFNSLNSHQHLNRDDENTEIIVVDHVESHTFNKATFWSCFVNLTSTIIGAGILGLPHAFAATGWIPGMALLLFFGAASAFALHLLSVCSKKVPIPATFYDIAAIALPKFSWLIDVAVAVKCYGVATSYLIVVGDLMPAAMDQLHGTNIWKNRQSWILVGFGVVAPLSCCQSLDSLKWTSAASLIFVAFLTVVVILYSIPGIGLDPCFDSMIGCSGHRSMDSFGLQSYKVLPVFIYGYTCQQVLPTTIAVFFLSDPFEIIEHIQYSERTS